MKKKYDVIVVGSGAGGGTVAYELTKRGKRVLIIEAGPVIKSEYLGSFWRTVVWPGYYKNLAAFSRSKEGAIIYHTKNVGGTTVFACGNQVRSLQKEFLEIGIDLEKYYVEVEDEMNVAPLNDNKIIGGSRAIVQAAQRLGYQMVPMPKGFNPDVICNLCGNCVLGCHQGAKWDARSYIDEAVASGATLKYSTKVQQVLFSNNGQVRGVKISGPDGKKEIECELVILAAGGLNTPVILQKSGVSAGNGLFIDFFSATYGIVKNLSQLKGATMGTVITEFHEKDGFILSPYVDHWSQLLLFCPSWWHIIHRFPRSRIIGIMTKITDERVGRVEVNGSISKAPTAQDRLRLQAGADMAREILMEAGAKDIITTQHPRGAHPGGTAAVGEVVDSDLKVKGCQGLYVCDASVFFQTLGLPPILSIVALAKWLATKF